MKQHLFTVHGWYCWLIHSLVTLGVLTALMFFLMQWEDVYVSINLPSVQRSGHK